jgi:hypothetical protein
VNGGTWVCGYVLEFSDGDEPEEQVLHIGTEEECKRVADLLPAVSYSGTRPDPEARMIVKPYPRDDPGV